MRWLYVGAVGASLLAGVLATVLIIDAGGGDVVVATAPVRVEQFGNERLLRPLSAVVVVLAALWLGALAASRVEKP
jgi:hypothetical protein